MAHFDSATRPEEKARGWVLASALPGMTWQNTGFHSREMTLIQDTVPARATDYAIWLLDFAEGAQRDLKQAIEVVRWSEERVVDWSRSDEPNLTRPFCSGWERAAGSGVKYMGRLAYCFARLYQETKDPLWKAKAESLVQGLMAAQDPVTGLIPSTGQRTFGGQNIIDMLDAAEAIATVPGILAKP